MAEDTTSTPRKGKKKAELIAELEERDRLDQSRRQANKVRLSVFPILALMLVVALGALFTSLRPQAGPSRVQNPKATGVTSTVSQETTLVPFAKDGTPSYTAFELKANEEWAAGRKGMWLALAERHGFKSVAAAQLAVHQHVLIEAVKGLDYYVQTVPKEGMWVVNTGLGASGYRVMITFLPKGDTYLVWDSTLASVPDARKGKEAIRRHCGNAITRTSGKTAWNPLGNPWFPGNPTYGNPPAVPVVTEGYPGNAENVTASQQSQPKGGVAPTPHGTPGTGSGGITPHATTSGSEVTEVAPAPTTGEVVTPATGETSDGETGDVP